MEGLRGVYGDQIGAKLVSKAAISTARRHMGSAVFEALYREQVRPLGMNGQSAMPGVFWRGHRVMALDGSTHWPSGCLPAPRLIRHRLSRSIQLAPILFN